MTARLVSGRFDHGFDGMRLRANVKQVVLLNGDGVLDHVLDQPYADQSTILIVLVKFNVWNAVKADRGVENVFARGLPRACGSVEEETEDGISVELAMYAVHLHYALPLSVTLVVTSTDGFSSQVCSHLRRLGRDSSVVPNWASSPDEVCLRDFLQCIHLCCTNEEHISKDDLFAMFKYRGERLMKNAWRGETG